MDAVEQRPDRKVSFDFAKTTAGLNYDILEDVANKPANVTIGNLLRDNPAYRKSLRPLLNSRKRR